MKIVHLIEQLGIGGAEKDLIEKSLVLSKKDVTLLVFCFYRRGILANNLERNNIQVISLENNSKPLSIIKGAFLLNKIMKNHLPDIIHSHMYSGEMLVSFYKLLFSTPAKCISSVQSLHTQIRKRNMPARKFLDRLVIKHYHKFIACSQAVKYELVHKGYPEKAVEVIYNGVDFSHCNSSHPDKKSKEKPIIGVISRLAHYKGIDFLIKAVPSVVQIYPQCEFWIIGDGSEKSNLIKLTNELNISRFVSFLGSQTNIHDYLSRLTILVVPSLCEPLGISAIEGLAEKIPVIATAVDGLPEIIINNKTGFLVQPGKPDEIANKIIWILQNYPEAQQIARQGFDYAKDTFNLQKVTEQQFMLYQTLLS